MPWLLTFLLTLFAGTPPDEPAVAITLTRTTCFGTCPAYSVRITSDGRVDYEGTQFVRVVGRATTTIAPEAVAELVAEFDRIGYFGLNARYDTIVNPDGTTGTVTDLPTTTTSIRVGSRAKEVADYIGAPPALRRLERRIDEVAGTMGWVSVTPDVIRELQREGWNAAGDEGGHYLRDAVARSDVATVDALLAANADPNDGGGLPPLFVAKDSTIIGKLIAAGANVNAVTGYGEPLLTFTVRRGRAEPVSILLEAGARVDATDSQNHTALTVAASLPPPPLPGEAPPPRELDRIIALLRAAGGK